MIRSALGIFPGWLQVHRAGYQKEQSLIRAMPLRDDVLDYLESSPLAKGYSARLCTDALFQAGNNLSGGRVCGVIPEKEIKTSKIAQAFFPELQKVPRGFKPARKGKGKFLSGKPGEIVLGEDLAKNLQVEIGEEVSFIGQDFYGSIASSNFKVVGIFHAGSPDYDQALALVNLEELQDLLYMPDMITELAVVVKTDSSIPQIANDIYKIVSNEQGPWEILPFENGLYLVKPKKPNLPEDSPLQLIDSEIYSDAVKRIPKLESFSPQVKAEVQIKDEKIPAFGVSAQDEERTSRIFSRLLSSKGLASLPQINNWLLLERSLAEKLSLELGDEVIVKGRNYLGEDYLLDLKLVGIYEKKGYDPEAYLSLDLLQEKLRLGENVHQFLLRLEPSLEKEKAISQIYSRLNYEVVPWQELMPDLVQFIALDNAGGVLWLLILLIVVAFVILLTVLMSVLERGREFGIMKAIGTKPSEVFKLIMLEAFILGFLGCSAGVVLGMIPSLYLTYIPLNLASVGEYMEEFSLEPYMYAQFEPRMVFWTFVIIFFFVVVMSIFPALRASRIKPTDVLRLQ